MSFFIKSLESFTNVAFITKNMASFTNVAFIFQVYPRTFLISMGRRAQRSTLGHQVLVLKAVFRLVHVN